jgi:hypothetical protein
MILISFIMNFHDVLDLQEIDEEKEPEEKKNEEAQ